MKRSLWNQQAMEQALGKLVMDGGFREAFFVDPGAAAEAAGIPLTDAERTALARIRPGALAAFQRYLEAKRVGDCPTSPAHDPHDTSVRSGNHEQPCRRRGSVPLDPGRRQ